MKFFMLILFSFSLSCSIETPSKTINCCSIQELKGEGEKPLKWYDVSTQKRHIGDEERILTSFSPGFHEISLECGDGKSKAYSSYVYLLSKPPKEDLGNYVETLAECEVEKKKTGLEWWLKRFETVTLDPKEPKLALHNPTNLNSISGFSGMTSGFSKDGDLTLLLYPGPGYSDHVEYETTNANLKRRGANKNMGAFGGILSEDGDLIFLRDFDLISQRYSNDESTNIVTKYSNSDWIVTQNDFMTPPPNEVLIRDFSFQRKSATLGKKFYFVHYENLSPTTYRISHFPFADNALDFFNDFGVFHHSSNDTVFHFRPFDQKWDDLFQFAEDNPIVEPLSSKTRDQIQKNVNHYVDSFDDEFGKGVYFGISSTSRETSLVFASTTFASDDPIIPIIIESNYSIPFSPYRVGRSGSASYYHLEIDDSHKEDSVSVVISAGESMSEARDGLVWAKDFCGNEEEDEQAEEGKKNDCISKLMILGDDWWGNKLKDIILPNTDNQEELSIYKRGIIVNVQSQSTDVGSMVASVSVTPNYNADWIRDGSYLNLFLDMNGFHELVTKHVYFWESVQRKTGEFSGTYEMNYFSDGAPGGPVELEIDQVGLSAWSMCLHSQFLEMEEERELFLARIYPSIKRSVDFLYRWRDESTGLPRKANVDDNMEFQVNLQGTLAVLLGLKAGVFCGRIVKEDESVLERWEDYGKQIEGKILSGTFFDEEYQAWGFESANFTGQGIRGASWFLWPVIFVPLDSSDAIKQTKALRNVTSGFEKCYQGMYGYPPQSVIAMVMSYMETNDTEGLGFVRDSISKFTKLMPTPETGHYGEWTYLENSNPECTSKPPNKRRKVGERIESCCDTVESVQVNSMPHNWEHALVNLIMRKFYGPWPKVADSVANVKW